MSGVSAELSINKISDGINEGKYMLISMENTISGKVSYSISNSPRPIYTLASNLSNTRTNDI